MLVTLGTKRVKKIQSIQSGIHKPKICFLQNCPLLPFLNTFHFTDSLFSVLLYSTHGTCALVLGTDLFRHSEMIISERSGHRNSPVDKIIVKLLANSDGNNS